MVSRFVDFVQYFFVVNQGDASLDFLKKENVTWKSFDNTKKLQKIVSQSEISGTGKFSSYLHKEN